MKQSTLYFRDGIQERLSVVVFVLAIQSFYGKAGSFA
ncbi:hypothetical protein HDE68_005398 [Pedobacter cryoconitis]|uniref:Uncharacterized protein n=1 Tax=Pedobacter cryoconitis TaxID=188932 RepID=A0A7W8ZSN0_9SPHI|nr:hypothetical protein [Pedobacter cryoconitis]